MTYPIQPGTSFRAAEIGEAVKHFSFFQNSFVQYRRLTVCSSIAAVASHHHEGSMDPLRLFLLDQGFPVEYELDESNTPHTGTTLRHPQNWLCLLRCKIRYFFTAQHFLETFTLLPETTRTTNSRGLQRFSPQTENTTFATLWRTYLPRTSNNALT